MGLWMMRLLGLVAGLISASLTYMNWQRLINNGTYSFRIAALAPIGVAMGLYVMLFPTKAGVPQTALDKFLAFLVLGIGVAAGAYNGYRMDPASFSFLGF